MLCFGVIQYKHKVLRQYNGKESLGNNNIFTKYKLDTIVAKIKIIAHNQQRHELWLRNLHT